jgi:hypothetical protein
MLENKCCLYVIISIRFFSITICNLLIEFPTYICYVYFQEHLVLNDLLKFRSLYHHLILYNQKAP